MTTRTSGSDTDRTTSQRKDQMETLKEDMGHMGRLAKTAAAEKVDEMRERAREVVSAGREKAVQYEDALLEKVRTHPLQTVAVAAGVGFVLGFLTRRRP